MTAERMLHLTYGTAVRCRLTDAGLLWKILRVRGRTPLACISIRPVMRKRYDHTEYSFGRIDKPDHWRVTDTCSISALVKKPPGGATMVFTLAPVGLTHDIFYG